MLEELRKQVCAANLELVARNIVIYTWGNVSGLSNDRRFMVIKPSGVDYSHMTPEDMVVVSVEDGITVEGKWKPSSDSKTHLELYRAFHDIMGVAHTHSTNAVAFAQAGMAITSLGTTQADDFNDDIPCTRELSCEEVMSEYEFHTGKVIVDTIRQLGYAPLNMPGILVKNHGPFTWGTSPAEAVYHAVILETVAEMNFKTLLLNPNAKMERYLLDKHYGRKHGPDAYYGQPYCKETFAPK